MRKFKKLSIALATVVGLSVTAVTANTLIWKKWGNH
jgi:hypothetical protein